MTKRFMTSEERNALSDMIAHFVSNDFDDVMAAKRAAEALMEPWGMTWDNRNIGYRRENIEWKGMTRNGDGQPGEPEDDTPEFAVLEMLRSCYKTNDLPRKVKEMSTLIAGRVPRSPCQHMTNAQIEKAILSLRAAGFLSIQGQMSDDGVNVEFTFVPNE